VSGRFHKSVTRHFLFAGAEREAAGVVFGLGGGLIAMAWQFMSVACAVLAILFLTVGAYAIRQIAKRDPQMFRVYRRYIGYRAYYPARSTPFRRG
jgi:type IV secretory pathway TrbD component